MLRMVEEEVAGRKARSSEWLGPTEETTRLLQFRDLCNKLARTNFPLASNPPFLPLDLLLA